MTWRHVAILGMCCMVVGLCSLTQTCARESLGQVITFASVIAGIVGGHASRNDDNKHKPPTKE